MEGRVYLLRNPLDNTVFYVGQTIYKLSERLRGHLSEKGNSNKVKIILEIIENKLLPSIEELECHDYNESNIKLLNEREVFWINHYNPIGNKLHVEVHVKTCKICNNVFESKRKNGLYCSGACRARANQIKNKSIEKVNNNSFKFQKRNKCEYCEAEMEAKYRNKRFCSPKCRVYFNRENVQLILKNNKQIQNIENIVPELPNEKEIKNDEILKEIQKIRNETIPKERDKPMGRKVWENEQKARINELMSKLVL